MPGTEIYENLSNAATNAALPLNFNGWITYRESTLGVVLDGTDKVLTGKGTDTGSKRLAKALIAAGEFGRCEAKVKLTNIDLQTKSNNFINIGFSNTANISTITGGNKRAVILSYEVGKIGFKYWNGTTGTVILDVNSIPLNAWVTVGLVTDGSGKYTGYVKDDTGAILGSGSFTIAGDAGLPLWAYVDFGYNQQTQDANGWGTQYYIKDIIARDDFYGYNEASQRRHLHFEASINGGDPAYMHIPKDWNPDVSPEKVILSGHGYGAPIGFTTSLSAPFPDAGFVYGISNTHGNTWGNTQAVSDIEEMRKWVVQKCKGSEQVNLHGASMGCLEALNYAANYPDKVKKIVTEIGVTSLQAIYKDATFTASINTAFGVTRFRDIPKVNNPIRSVENLVGIPVMCWAGTSDTTAPHGLHSRPYVDKLARLGGTVMYIEEPGETHSLDVDPGRYVDFYNAETSLSGTASTAIINLEEHSVYEIKTSAPNILSYVLDSNQGALTAITATKTTIKTKSRPMTVLLKLTDMTHTFSNIAITKKS